MTQWWNMEPEDGWRDPVDSAAGSTGSPEKASEAKEPRSRKRLAVKIGAASAVGALALGAALSGGDDAPPAEAAPRIEVFPPAGETPAEALPPQDRSAAAEPQAVVLAAEPDGSGRSGPVLRVTLRNATEQPVVVMPSLLRGDGRPAIVGEGTLAPGARTVAPGGAATGTLEFASEDPPQFLVLTDLNGTPLATAEVGR